MTPEIRKKVTGTKACKACDGFGIIGVSYTPKGEATVFPCPRCNGTGREPKEPPAKKPGN